MKINWGFRKAKPAAKPSFWGKETAILLIEERSDGPVVSIGKGEGKHVEWYSTLNFPDSPDCLAHAFVHYLGQPGPEALARLATFANPESATFFHYYELILERMVHTDSDGTMSLNRKYFQNRKGLVLPNEREWRNLFQLAPPIHGENMSQGHFDLALAAERVVEDLVFALAGTAGRLSGSRQLCLSGQQVLTPPVVGTLVQTGLFDRINFGPECETPVPITAPIPSALDSGRKLAAGELVLWWKKPGEGYLLADPRNKDLKDRLRSWQDRAIANPMDALALAPEAEKYLEMKGQPQAKRLSLKLLKTQRRPVPLRYFGWSWQDKSAFEKSCLPAITHADFSVWAQFPDPAQDPYEWQMLRAFYEISACPLLAIGSLEQYPGVVIE
ncbi:MAG: hypothetical protein IPG32_00085 [Saprospirales bacterium]|nr:hypothetical protein [Saprospirales bacterium]